MTATVPMFDAITAANVPAGAQLVAGYVDGHWPSFFAFARTHPRAVRVSIAVDPAHDAQVLDCERFDATPADCPGWAERQRRRGQVPTVYCNTAGWPAVVDEFRRQRVPLPQWWAANYDDGPRIPAGAIGVQYQDYQNRYDLSVVYATVAGWGLDGVAHPPHPSAPHPPPAGPPTYRVQPGDTLSGLAERFHVTLQALMAWNPIIHNPNMIQAGWRLIVGPDPRLHKPAPHVLPRPVILHPPAPTRPPARPPATPRLAVVPAAPVPVPRPAAPVPAPAPPPAPPKVSKPVNRGPLQVTNPAWWATLATVVLSVLGITDANLSTAVQGVVAGVAGLVVSVYTAAHHKTIRNADSAAAAIKVAALNAQQPARAPQAVTEGIPELTRPAAAPAAPPAGAPS